MKKIALIAHNGKKDELIAWAIKNQETLKKYQLIATATTGTQLEKVGLTIEKMKSGPMGGDAQIAAQVAEGKIDLVIFMRDPLGLHVHEPDISMLLRQCDVHNIALATNESSASLIIKSIG